MRNEAFMAATRSASDSSLTASCGRRPKHRRLPDLFVTVVGCLVGLALSGCYDPPAIEFVPDDVIASAPASSDYPAEILYRSETLVTDIDGGWDTTYQRHEVRKIYTAAGEDYAEFQVTWGESQELVELRGRTVLPDGTVYEIDESNIFESEADDRSFVFLRMPRAEPGAVVELYYTLYASGYIWYDWTFEPAQWSVPVRRYRVEVLGSDVVAARLKAYVPGGRSLTPTRTDLGSMWRLSASLDDIAPARSERMSPPSAERQPRFHYRVKRIGSRTSYGHAWPSQLHWLAKDVYVEREWAEGFEDPGAPVCAAPDEDCVRDVVASVHRDVIAARQTRLGDARPLGDVLASGEASNYEAALLVYHRLEQNGVSAYLAAGNGDLGGRLDETIPMSQWLNHAFVQVRDGEARLWIDPSCARCELGEVPAQVLENRAVVFRRKGRKTVTSVENVLAEPAPSDTETITYDVTIDETGRGVVLEVNEERGSHGEWRADGWHTAEASERDEKYLRSIDTAVRWWHPDVESVEPELECSSAEGRCTQRLRYVVPKLAQVVDDRLVIPLRLVSNPLGLDPRDKRTTPVELRESSFEANVEVRIPEGFEVAHCPEPRNATALRGTLSARFSCEVGDDVVRLRYALDTARASVPPDEYAELAEIPTFFADLAREAVVLQGPPPSPAVAEVPPTSDESPVEDADGDWIDE